uniref:SH3 domain-containing protein n=1 Tax=Photinus pyralis TaxID=7054 RepID=A0A1Y1L8G7_PHOPY
MFNFLLFYKAVFILNAFLVNAQLSEKRLCGNEDCSEVIGEGKTILRYATHSNDPRLLSFQPNELVKIYSKAAGINKDLWGVEINGVKGYVPNRMLRESRTLKNPTFEVDVEPISKVPSKNEQPQLEVTKAYTVVDGTTIYNEPDINPSSTESTVQPSLVPKPDNSNPQQTEPLPLPASTVHPETTNPADGPSTTSTSQSLHHKESAANNSTETIDLPEHSIKGNDNLSDKKETGSTIENIAVSQTQNTATERDTVSDSKAQSDDVASSGDDEEGEDENDEADDIDMEEDEKEEDDPESTQTSKGEETSSEQKEEKPLQSTKEESERKEDAIPNSTEGGTRTEQEESAQTSKGEESKSEQTEEPILSSKEESEQNEAKSSQSTKGEGMESEQAKEPTPSEMVSEQNEAKPTQFTKEESEQKEESAQTSEGFEVGSEQKSGKEYELDPSLAGDKQGSKIEEANQEESGEQESTKNDTDEKLEAQNNSHTSDVLDNTTEGYVDETKFEIQNDTHMSTPEGAVASQTDEEKAHEAILEQPELSEQNSEIPHKQEQNVISLQSEYTQNATAETEAQSGSSFTDSSAEELAAVSGTADKGSGSTPLFPYAKHSEDYLSMSNNLGLDNGPDRSSSYNEYTNGFLAPQDINSESAKEEDVKIVEEVAVESSNEDEVETHLHDFGSLLSRPSEDSCSADCKLEEIVDTENGEGYNLELPIISYKILTVLVITAVTVVVFLWGYAYIDKRGREGILIGKINHLQKQFLITQKENELLTNKLADIECEFDEKSNIVSSEAVANLEAELEEERESRSVLEAQVKVLEKELENSTEVGMELNRMLSQILNSENGSDTLVANIEQLQRQIIEQQDLINNYNDNLNVKETENHELRLEVDINNTKVTELQSELNKMALTLLKLEEDKDTSQSMYENELDSLRDELANRQSQQTKETNKFNDQMKDLTDKYEEVKRNFELKSNEYRLLKENVSQIKKLANNSDGVKSLLDVTAIQAELLQLRSDKQLLMEQLQVQSNNCSTLESRYETVLQDCSSFKEKYDLADREKVEAVTKLEVLDKYFKEREAQLQRELSKQESMWVEKQGEATSTIERIKYMQEELQNYKAQNESLKQEILEQEVQMKSQISVLEKKAHENWVAVRQTERKLDDAKQEAALLRNRLTLQERTLNEEKMHNRIQSPIELNGEIQGTPTHMANDAGPSPSLLFGTRENLTISPPLPGLPFLPPPPGVPFMPPPLGGVPLHPPAFMPPPPSLLPGDHRPPPLGRISSPPLNSRFQHDRAYSPYSRNSPSPTSDDDYDRMPIPPMYGGYNSYNREDRRDDNRRDLHRPPPMMNNIRNSKGPGHSSGSANSTESLEKINRHNSKV